MDEDLIATTAVLIDADNVSVDVLSEVLKRLANRQRLQHRRAYGSLQKANEFAALCQAHAIRFVATTYAGTNGTDVALAIDAIELAINEPVDEFVLVTSDCDFLPLAVRLRELGCHVVGFGQKGKSAVDVKKVYEAVYDEFHVIAASVVRTRSAAPRAAPRKSVRAVAVPAPIEESAATPQATVSMLHPPVDDEVRRILEAVPALLDGKKVELGTAAKLLREARLLAKNAPSPKLFSKYPLVFELTPTKQPNKVQYRGR